MNIHAIPLKCLPACAFALLALTLNAQSAPSKTGGVDSPPGSAYPSSKVDKKDKAGSPDWNRAPRDPRHASKVIGLPVENLRQEKLGEIEDIVVDLGSGRLVGVIISSGGFLGMGDELSVIPSRQLRLNAEGDKLTLDVSRESLAAAPRYRPGEKPDFTSPAYTGYLSDHSGIGDRDDKLVDRLDDEKTRDPIHAAAYPADNSGRNTRDRDSATLDPLDQGNSPADIETTKRIRKAVMDRDGLSTNAKNVKIITRDTRVTLRGPVATAQEKRVIGEIAVGVAGAASVTNQLEIAP